MRKSLYEHCKELGMEYLLSQWDEENNGEITPHSVSYGSKKRVWWTCEKGHRWQSVVYSRTGGGTGCPHCSHNKPLDLPYTNSLAVRYPIIASQWHPTLNGALKPEDVAPGTHKKVWWTCERGHEWQATINSRANGKGCPICVNRKALPGDNDLDTVNSELAAQWHPSKNGSLTPQDVTAGCEKKVWWQCEKGHEWKVSIASRYRSGSGCPVCAGKVVIPGKNDLASNYPAIAEQWNHEKNGQLTPQSIAEFSNKRVWWRCEKGHEYQMSVQQRTRREDGCPYCAGRKVLAGFNDLATLEPRIAGQWHESLNGTLTPEMVTVGSHKYVWWQCPYGHIWKAVVYSRAGKQKNDCPVCAGKVKLSRKQRYDAILAASMPADTLSVSEDPTAPEL